VGIIYQPENRSVEESDQPDGILSKRKSLRGRGLSKALPLLRVISKPDQIDRRAQALRPYSNGFCPQCRGELRSPKRYIIKAQVPYGFCPQCRGELRSPKRYIIKAQVPYVACGAGFRVGGANKAMIN